MIFKKRRASEQERPDVAVRRQARFDAQPVLDRARLVFIAEPKLQENDMLAWTTCPPTRVQLPAP